VTTSERLDRGDSQSSLSESVAATKPHILAVQHSPDQAAQRAMQAADPRAMTHSKQAP